jgi:hypothetical protein
LTKEAEVKVLRGKLNGPKETLNNEILEETLKENLQLTA